MTSPIKLFYVTTARIPTEKANGIQILKMCEAFQQQGLDVELIVPTRIQPDAMQQIQNIWQHYGIETPFRIRYVSTPDFLRFEGILPKSLSRILYYLQCFLFSLGALWGTCTQQQGVYYSRSLQTIFLLCLTKWIHRKKIYFEAHELHGDSTRKSPGRFLLTSIMRWMLRHIDGLIVITHRLHDVYCELGMQEPLICVAPDGVDENRIPIALEQAEARQQVGISLDKKIVCYTGHLFKWKGVYTLAESSRWLSDRYVIYIVGGTASDIQALQHYVETNRLPNIVIPGYVPYTEVPAYAIAADMLVLPNSAKKEISREYTSPLKLFEYMQARRPIVASDLPSIREVLRHRDNAYLVSPDDPKALADGIRLVMDDRSLSQQIADTAYQDVQAYTWNKRAEKIGSFF